jgi:hypothetical protein
LNPMKRLAEFQGGGLPHALGRCLSVAVCAVALVAAAQASDPIDNSPRDNPSLVTRPSDVAAGKLVQSPEGTVIGTVHDVLPEPANGQPAYILVATDSGLTAIPYWVIGHLILDAHIVIDRSKLAEAPRMPRGAKPEDSHWREQADDYWSAYY